MARAAFAQRRAAREALLCAFVVSGRVGQQKDNDHCADASGQVTLDNVAVITTQIQRDAQQNVCTGDCAASPRARGGCGGSRPNCQPRPGGSPPLARGRRPPLSRYDQPVRITPARAGTALLCGPRSRPARDHPRSRGDGIDRLRIDEFYAGSPPLARGRHKLARGQPRRDGITPARAGTASVGQRKTLTRRDHPRSRGDGQVDHLFRLGASGSPPARAGTAATGTRYTAFSPDHPRSRGDGLRSCSA